MPFDGNTSKTKDFTKEEFLAWARTKKPGQRYHYCDNYDCAIAQFLKETGRCEAPMVYGNLWDDEITGKTYEFDDNINQAALGENGCEDYVFGKLVKRLESLG